MNGNTLDYIDRSKESDMVTWQRTDDVEDVVYGSMASWCYRLAGLGAAWWVIVWAVAR